MKDKHTPGPWKVDDTHVRTSINSERKHIAMVNLVNNRDYEISLEEHTANAKLIAAAPKLLAALEKLYAHTKNNHCICGINFEAEAAIKKARGKS